MSIFGSNMKNKFIVLLKKNNDYEKIIKKLNHLNIKYENPYVGLPNIFNVFLNKNDINAISKISYIKSLEIDRNINICGSQLIDNSVLIDNWGLARINQRGNLTFINNKSSYTYSRLGKNIDIYVIDTGILPTHLEFTGPSNTGNPWTVPPTSSRVTRLFDYRSTESASGGGPVGTAPSLTNPSSFSIDDNGHGTHVSSTICGGKYGVAKQGFIYSLKSFDSNGQALLSSIISAISVTLQHHNTKSNGHSSILNMSFAGEPSSSLTSSVTSAINAGIVCVAAAGNSNISANDVSPANISGVITAGGSTISDSRLSSNSSFDLSTPTFNDQLVDGSFFDNTITNSSFIPSNTGSVITVFAPGNKILSAWNSNDTSNNLISGTSSAAAHVSGVCAMYLENKTKLTTSTEVASVLSFISNNATNNVLSNIPSDTVNKELYSFFTFGNLIWKTTDTLDDIKENQLVSITLEAESLDQFNFPRTITYSLISGSLPSGLTLDTSTGIISGISSNVVSNTLFTFTVEANDGLSILNKTFSLTVLNINLPPVWSTSSGTLGTFNEGDTITSIALVATDPNNDTLTFSLLNGSLPTGLTISNSGVISGTVSNSIVTTTSTIFSFTIRVSDGLLFVDRNFSITILKVNTPPTWSTPSGILREDLLSDPIVGTSFTFNLQATDIDSDPITFSLVSGSLPGGLILDSTSGVISGIISLTAGTFNFTISITDTFSTPVNRSFFINVISSPTDSPPVWITSSGNIFSGTEGDSVFITLQAVDPENTTLTFSLAADPIPNTGETAGLPPGTSISTNGIIFGTLSDPGKLSNTFVFNISVSDSPLVGSVNIVTRKFSITVNQQISLNIPSWVTPAGSLGTVLEGQVSIFKILATDPNNSSLTYSVIAGSLPLGISLDANTGLLMGIFDCVDVNETFSFIIKVSNGILSIDRLFSITVSDFFVGPSLSVSFQLTNKNKTDWQSFSSTIGNDEDIYRLSDPNFGRVIEPKIEVLKGLNFLPSSFTPKGILAATSSVGVKIYKFLFLSSTFDTDSTTFDSKGSTFDSLTTASIPDVFSLFLKEHHKKTNVFFGPIKLAIARDSSDNSIYEVLYREILDPQDGSAFSFNYPQSSSVNHTQNISTINPISIDNMRQELLNNIGISSSFELLPRWMTSEQIVGDPTSILGYTAAIPIVYLSPNKGNSVLSNLTTDQKNNLLGDLFTIDRYRLQSFSNSKCVPAPQTIFDNTGTSLTFDSNITTFDTNLTGFDLSIETVFDANTTIFDLIEYANVDSFILFN